MSANPWGLSARQVEVLEALIRHGCHKGVARELGTTDRAAHNHVARIKERMGAAHTIAACVVWAKWSAA